MARDSGYPSFEVGEKAIEVYPTRAGDSRVEVEVIGGPNDVGQYYVQAKGHPGFAGHPHWHWPLSSLRKVKP